MQLSQLEITRRCGMIFLVGWDKRQLSRAGPPLEGLPLVGRRSHSLAGPTLLSADPQGFSTHASKLHDLDRNSDSYRSNNPKYPERPALEPSDELAKLRSQLLVLPKPPRSGI